ncbi:MAG: hypothetical protein R3C28_11285 [Pirellulaceae bacterium]
MTKSHQGLSLVVVTPERNVVFDNSPVEGFFCLIDKAAIAAVNDGIDAVERSSNRAAARTSSAESQTAVSFQSSPSLYERRSLTA